MPRKRSNSEGSVYFSETDERWEALLVVGRRPDGKLVRKKFTAKTRKAVTAKLDEAKKALAHGMPLPNNRTTVAEYAAYWLENVLPHEGLAPASVEFYKNALNLWVLPHVGHRTLTGPNALTPSDVQAMTAKLNKAGRSHRVQVSARTTLGKVLRAAETDGLVPRNVARLATRPGDKAVARKVKAFTPDEVARLLAGLDGTRWHVIVLVGACTGLRPQELLALHWSDVHLDRDPHVSVRLALSHVGGASLKAPKRPRSYRTVPLPPEAVAALRAWRKQQAEERLAAGPLWSTAWTDLVFTNEAGEACRVDSLRHAMSRVMPGAAPHRLRHSFATHLLEQGVPIHHVAELLGDTVAVVESTYSHKTRRKSEVASLISGVLGR